MIMLKFNPRFPARAAPGWTLRLPPLVTLELQVDKPPLSKPSEKIRSPATGVAAIVMVDVAVDVLVGVKVAVDMGVGVAVEVAVEVNIGIALGVNVGVAVTSGGTTGPI